MKNNIILGVFCTFLLIFSCSENTQNSKKIKENQITYTYNDGSQSIEIELKNSPERVATFAPHATEILLGLGLGDKMIIASTEEPVLPQYQEDYEKIPQKFVGHSFKMNKEGFLMAEPDFVFAYPYDMKQEALGYPTELIKHGINPFVLQSVASPDATLDIVFDDILTIGKIFSVQDRAEKLVNKMKEKLNANDFYQPKSDTEKPKVMLVNSFNNGVWISGALATDLINRAGGVNAYADISDEGAWVSYESMLDRNPDIIIITDIASRPMKFEEKVKILKTDPVLKDITAVKNNKIFKANHSDIHPGIRNVDFIIRMNNIFYKNGK